MIHDMDPWLLVKDAPDAKKSRNKSVLVKFAREKNPYSRLKSN